MYLFFVSNPLFIEVFNDPIIPLIILLTIYIENLPQLTHKSIIKLKRIRFSSKDMNAYFNSKFKKQVKEI